MTPSRYQKIKHTLAEALDLPNEQSRRSYLGEVCAGDPALRGEVESLLAQEEDDELEGCAEAVRARNERRTDFTQKGRRIGAYELLRELGRGGMGAVWLAQRADQQFEKLVAIKLVNRGTDTDEVLRRFHAERQILARLEHPNIARLIDGGMTDDDLPYFVMEYVDGSRVTDYCFAQNLSVAERLRLFQKICGAVQFAHQNLVVHRDLKPANILINADGAPKLLDFGIAKLLAGNADNWQVTVAGGERLTPAYASPEQVRGEAITTVSDIYTLGALLYEMLSDASAHRFSGLRPSPTELHRVVCEEEPARPSVAAREGEAARQLRGDLDTIILRALAKEPARRYPSAGSFAEDIRRYLNGRPVQARPDTPGYRARKFIARNWLGVAAAALVALAILGGAIGVFWEARVAQRRFDDVRQLANSFLFEFDDALANLPGATPVRHLMVRRALDYLDNLGSESRRDPTLQLEVADAYLKIGDVQGKPYAPNLGDTTGAMRSYEKALQIATALSGRASGSVGIAARRITAQAHENLGIVSCRLNQVEAATDHHRRALAIALDLLGRDAAHAEEWQSMMIRNRLGLGDAIMAGNHLHADVAHYRAALAHYREALPLCEQLAARNPANSSHAHRLMQTCSRIAAMLSEIGAATADTATLDEGFDFHRRTLELNRAALQQAPENVSARRNYAGELLMTAYALELAGRDAEKAIALSQEALEIDRALSAADPDDVEESQDLGHDYYVAGRAFQMKGEIENARASYQKSLAVLQPLRESHPDNIETAYDLARASRALTETMR